MQAMRPAVRLIDEQRCARCAALVASRRRIVHGYGDPEAGVVFIGEAPGRHGADRTGVPFSGDRSGRALQAMLAELGLLEEAGEAPRLRCFITNTVRCCPPGNRTPTPAEVRACEAFLDQELAACAARLIVPVGRVALREVGLRYLGRDPGPIRALHARPIDAGAIWIVPLIHPARIAHAQAAAFVAALRPLLTLVR